MVLISIVTFFNCAAAAVFLSMGATFVPVFLGLDLIAVIAAFLASYAAAKRIERVRVTSREVRGGSRDAEHQRGDLGEPDRLHPRRAGDRRG